MRTEIQMAKHTTRIFDSLARYDIENGRCILRGVLEPETLEPFYVTEAGIIKYQHKIEQSVWFKFVVSGEEDYAAFRDGAQGDHDPFADNETF